MDFQNTGIKIYDVSFYQTVMFDYIDGKRILLPPEKQKHIDFDKMRQKAKAVIIKAGQRNYKDPAFDISWKNAKQSGISRSTYWFCDKFDTPRNQAKLYWSFLKGDPGEGILSADFETGSWTDLNNLYVFINELQQLSGFPDYKIAVYTNYYYFMEANQNANRDWFGQFPLWMAHYIRDPQYVKIPPVWKECLIWQYGTPIEALEAGAHSKEIDGNYFNGDLSKFEKYFGKIEENNETPIPTPVPEKIKPIEIIGVYGEEKVTYKKEIK